MDLPAVLESLPSEASRYNFLRRVYAPGNREVADLILASDLDSRVIEQEMQHAKGAGDTQRFIDMGKKYVDYHVVNGLDSLLTGKIIEMQNLDIADYTIGRFSDPALGDKKLAVQYLPLAVKIATAFGMQEKATELLETILRLELARKDSRAADTLAQLGRSEEAIDLYLKEKEVYATRQALNLARERSPSRVSDIAKIGFSQYGKVAKADLRWLGFYVECAEIIGKTAQAKDQIRKYAAEIEPTMHLSVYRDIVDALLKLGERDDAGKLVDKVTLHHTQELKGSFDTDQLENLAYLQQATGRTEDLKATFELLINIGARFGNIPTIERQVTRAISATGDISFRKLLMEQYDRQGRYEQAAEQAVLLNMPKQAEAYRVMSQMVPVHKP